MNKYLTEVVKNGAKVYRREWDTLAQATRAAQSFANATGATVRLVDLNKSDGVTLFRRAA